METNLVDNYDDIDSKPKRSLKLIPILGSLMPIGLIVVTIIYLAIFQQDAVSGFLKKYDFIGVSETGKAEKYRLYRINNLNVPFEQRQALKQGTVFLGATKEMVELALGLPMQNGNEGGQEKWVYFFEGSTRPTYLFFQNGTLVNAAKGTTLDNAEIQ